MPSVFAPFSAFLFSFRLVAPLRFSCVSFYSLAFAIFVGLGPIAGAIYYTGCLLLTHLFVLRFVLRVASFFTLFYLVFILSVLVLLTLGLTSAKSHSHAQLIRAELSSNGSSEPRSESFSKLSSHQIPRCLDIEGTTTAKGLYANLFYVLTHYAFGGVSALCVLPRTQHSTSTSGSNRRVPPPRGSSSPAPLGHPLLPALALRLFSLTRRILTPRCAACGSTFSVGPLSLLLVLRLRHCARLCARCTCPGGGRMCFPVRDCRCLLESHSVSLRF